MKVLRLQNTFPNLAFCTYCIMSKAGKNIGLLGKVLMFLGFLGFNVHGGRDTPFSTSHLFC